MMYIVTGVDGQLGGKVAENMVKEISGEQLIFTAPDLGRIPAEKMKKWKNQGVSIRTASYDDKEQMIAAFQGGDRIYMVSSIKNGPERQQQHKNTIEAIKESGLSHVTYTSFLGADQKDRFQYVLPDHTMTEELIHESGLEWNVMRNNLYLENYLISFPQLSLVYGNKWRTTAGEGKATFIAKDDSGRVAAALLLGKGEHNTAYNVTGTLISEREICEMVSERMGIEIEYIPMTNEEYFEWMDSIYIPRTTDGDYSKSPVPWCSNDMVTNEAGIREGFMAVETDTVEKLTGRKPLKACELVEVYAHLWSSK